jgi:hypothetical protein
MGQEDWNLHLAAEKNRIDIAHALIARGDDCNSNAWRRSRVAGKGCQGGTC